MAFQNYQKPDAPQLSPKELFEKRKQRDSAKLKSYNVILEKIYTRIRTSSREGLDPWILYTIPPFVIGAALMDQQDLVVYLVYMLRNQGYEVKYTYPNLLYISWKHHEKDYLLKGSPIMQSMLAAQNTKPKQELRNQSTTRVRFSETVQQPASAMSRGGSRQGKAPPRSVTSYEPPASFLDAIEKAPIAEPRKSALDDFLNF